MPDSLPHAAAFVGVGILGGFGHLILIKHEHAPASRLAPFSYSQLIWVALIGFVVFGGFPDQWSLLGIAILISSGICKLPATSAGRNDDRARTSSQPLATTGRAQ